ncbi:hypothetical protein ACWA16_13490 [Bacillus subtilis]|uniref:hypothetical protein n=1 Tax=Bacillus TaxID=1386 RepID=UPI0013790315|nr:hypothetical protein [Bacillus subtilis]MEC1490562.1 hypothetical protein [Bacillus subtilis]NRF02343.1 hypothetical protein [Bacillus subtilis]NRG36021.1 hypothetical protein [Bacillus subtilis]
MEATIFGGVIEGSNGKITIPEGGDIALYFMYHQRLADLIEDNKVFEYIIAITNLNRDKGNRLIETFLVPHIDKVFGNGGEE